MTSPIFLQVDDKTVLVVLFGVDLEKAGPVMSDASFIEMIGKMEDLSKKEVWIATPMGPPPASS